MAGCLIVGVSKDVMNFDREKYTKITAHIIVITSPILLGALQQTFGTYCGRPKHIQCTCTCTSGS